ncbi:RlpA-like double-psi beta-barrel-protein domain-containing protein-containing protein [Thamnidium elegans]|nr:RlpA-like double-psi beta-barrel-protein domain-containing protein-containing protein [Thamnidium elegans]
MQIWHLLFITISIFHLVESRKVGLPLIHNRKSSGRYSGRATWFIPSKEGGSLGACGPREEDDDLVVALNAVQYGNMSRKSQHCGKSVRISYKGVTVKALVNDACPECGHGDLDLTQPVFNKLGPLTIGVLPITWEFI